MILKLPKAKVLGTRRRYIAIGVASERPINDGKELFDSVSSSIMRMFGEYGASRAELALIEFDASKQQAIIRCSHKELDSARAAIVGVTSVGNVKVIPRILLVSGTLKALRKKTENTQHL